MKNAPFIIFSKWFLQVLIRNIYKIECPFHDGSCVIQKALRNIDSFQIESDQCKYRYDFIISFNEVKREGWKEYCKIVIDLTCLFYYHIQK